MVNAATSVALLALIASTTAVQLFSLDHDLVAMTSSAQAVQTQRALLAAVASIYRELHGADPEAAGADAFAAVSAALGVIEYFTAAEGYADSAMARELRVAHLLPAAATATFFLGQGLLFVDLRAGGGAVAGEGPVNILVKIVLGATAVLVGLMALAR